MIPETNVMESDVLFKARNIQDLKEFWIKSLTQVMEATGYQKLGPLRMEYGRDGPQPFLMIVTANYNKTVEWIRRIRGQSLVLKGSGLKIISVDNSNEFSRYTFLYRNSVGLTQASILVGDVSKVAKCIQKRSFSFSSIGNLFVDLEEMDSITDLMTCCMNLKMMVLRHNTVGCIHVLTTTWRLLEQLLFGGNLQIHSAIWTPIERKKELKKHSILNYAKLLLSQDLAERVVVLVKNQKDRAHFSTQTREIPSIALHAMNRESWEKMRKFSGGMYRIAFIEPALVRFIDFNYNTAVLNLDNEESGYIFFQHKDEESPKIVSSSDTSSSEIV